MPLDLDDDWRLCECFGFQMVRYSVRNSNGRYAPEVVVGDVFLTEAGSALAAHFTNKQLGTIVAKVGDTFRQADGSGWVIEAVVIKDLGARFKCLARREP